MRMQTLLLKKSIKPSKAIRTFTRASPTGSMVQALFVDQSFFGALSQAILATI